MKASAWYMIFTESHKERIETAAPVHFAKDGWDFSAIEKEAHGFRQILPTLTKGP